MLMDLRKVELTERDVWFNLKFLASSLFFSTKKEGRVSYLHQEQRFSPFDTQFNVRIKMERAILVSFFIISLSFYWKRLSLFKYQLILMNRMWIDGNRFILSQCLRQCLTFMITIVSIQWLIINLQQSMGLSLENLNVVFVT